MNKLNRYGMRSPTRLYLGLLFGVSMLLPTAANAVKPTTPPGEPPAGNNIDLGGGFVENMGFVSAADDGLDFTNEAIRHMAVSIGQLGGVNPETGDIVINQGNLLPLVARELDITGFAFFYTNVYISGDTFVYGAFYGSGAGISNIPVANITGSLAERPEIQHALQAKLDSDGVWETLDSSTANIATLQLITALLDQSISDTNNPHQVTAAQIGAYTAEDTEALVSNALFRIQSISYIATNHVGNISITGSVSVLSLQVTSNVTARMFYGDGSGLTNLSIAGLSGSLAERPEMQAALETKLDAEGVWTAINGNASGVSNLQPVVSILNTAMPTWNAAYTWGNHAVEAYANHEELITLTSVSNNPHQVSAEQLGALLSSGGNMSGHIDMSRVARIINLPDPANDMDAVSKSYLERRLNHILPQGDIGMGIYTNSPR